MSVVDVVTKDGQFLGRINDLNQTVEMTDEWKEIAEKPRKSPRKKTAKRKEPDDRE